MTCPFLKEAQVRYCRTASVRKLIPIDSGGGADEKCNSAAHQQCSVYRENPAHESESGPCPYLRESLMQYCGAAPVPRFVPYSESLLSRCGNNGFRYCELYLGMAHPKVEAADADTIPVPDWLSFSANHMWLDITADGVCHAGVDAFLARVLGPIERLTYLAQKGSHHATAVLTAGGIDLQVVFPNTLLVSGCNLYLRANPSRITAEPYTGGWLFEGTVAEDTTAGLMAGAGARTWMEHEQLRMNEFVQQHSGNGQYAADGGVFAPGLARLLDRDSVLSMFHEFFSPFASGKR